MTNCIAGTAPPAARSSTCTCHARPEWLISGTGWRLRWQRMDKPRWAHETVIRHYWACNNRKHRHIHQNVAARCIAKKVGPRKHQLRWTDELINSAMECYLMGATLKETGKQFGICGGWMAQLLNKAIRQRSWGDDNLRCRIRDAANLRDRIALVR